MLGLKGLHRKVAGYMAAVALGGLALTTVGWGLIYAIFFDFSDADSDAVWSFNAVDYFGLAVFAVIGVITAIWAAAMLSKRIASPVTSVAAAARRMADGDLTARAAIDDVSMGEVVDLAHDFNLMAARLEKLATEATQWNAIIAHELRTPLTILRGRLQGAVDGIQPVEGPILPGLLTQVESLTRLVEDLRTLSLAENGHLFLQRAPVSLAAIVETQRQLMDPPLRKAGFEVTWTAAEITITADATRLGQALLALLENARLHATPGPLRVTAATDGK